MYRTEIYSSVGMRSVLCVKSVVRWKEKDVARWPFGFPV